MASINDGLYVGNATTKPLTALNARLAQGAHWATNSAASFDVRTGVVYAGVSSLLSATAATSPMSVSVAPFHVVGSKGASNGMYLPSSPDVESVEFAPAPALGQKRIDVVYAIQSDSDASVSPDANISASVAVRTGTTHPTNPVKPDVAVLVPGAVEVGTVAFDSSSTVATATNQAQVTVATTCRWTVLRGAPIPVRNAAERDALGAYKGLRVLRLDLGGAVETYNGTAWNGVALTSAAKSGKQQHWGSATINTDGSGFATITHGAGFTPTVVLVQYARDTGTLYPNLVVGSLTSTTFRVRVLDSSESAAASITGLPITYFCGE